MGCVGSGVGSQFAQRARPDEAAMAVGVVCGLAAAGGKAARIGSRPGVAQRKAEGRKRPGYKTW